MKPCNLLLQTDAYHQTMGQLIRNPMEIESYVLYARRGGPQVVPDLTELLQTLLLSKPRPCEVQDAAAFWFSQGVPFPEEAWLQIAQMSKLPLEVRGVRDGEVVLPGDPIAIFTGPSALVACLEPILEARLMTSMQVGTRFVKCTTALHGDTTRLFEVGLRAATSAEDHLAKLKVLRRLGLKLTSNGEAARLLGLRAVGTMGHRYTQRFTGQDADYQAFQEALARLVKFRENHGIEQKLPLSFLLDTRNTLNQGLPAALRVIRENHAIIKQALNVSVRLDSGDLRAQFRQVIAEFKALDREYLELQPSIIVESGLTAESIAEFENLAEQLEFPRHRVLYGLGGYLVGGLDRDAIALVYKIVSFGGQSLYDLTSRTPTMKFGDEPGAGKESYPGDFDLWERDGERSRTLALIHEQMAMTAKGYRPVFIPLVHNGSLQAGALRNDEEVRTYACRRWQEITGGYIGEAPDFTNDHGEMVRRPRSTEQMQRLIDFLREQQFSELHREIALEVL